MLNIYLKDKGISSYWLSKTSGISYTAINELVRGERKIDDCSVRVLIALAKALKIDINELYCICAETKKLDPSLYVYFWDSKPEQLDIKENKDFIISRLLNNGGYDGYKFVQETYTYEEIKETAQKYRDFSPKVISFLCNVYNIKQSECSFYKMKDQNWR